jgi:cation diffusion facilitator CzcD-associated flavoprotein CzcO
MNVNRANDIRNNDNRNNEANNSRTNNINSSYTNDQRYNIRNNTRNANQGANFVGGNNDRQPENNDPRNKPAPLLHDTGYRPSMNREVFDHTKNTQRQETTDISHKPNETHKPTQTSDQTYYADIINRVRQGTVSTQTL